MAKKRKTKSRVQRMDEAYAERLGAQLREDEARRRRQKNVFDSAPVYPRRKNVTPANMVARADEKRRLRQAPHQLRLHGPEQRAALVRALEVGKGRPIGRRTREKLRGLVPEALRETICAKKRQKRAVMFAQKTAGKGLKSASRKPRKETGQRC